MYYTHPYKEERDKLVDSLRLKGIHNERVLAAIGKVPRHLFVDEKYKPEELYSDIPLSIGEGQTISQPFTVAYQSQLLQVLPGEKILEIGTGSGYQAAVLHELGAIVYSIERHEKLYKATKKRLHELGYTNVTVVCGDGHLGIQEYSPYDKIIVTAAAPQLPKTLLRQLKVNGKMVVPVNGQLQRMQRITKRSETQIEVEDLGHFKFVPMLPGIVVEP